MLAEVIIILALVLANGFFAAAEIAIVASRRGRLEKLAESGDGGARTALELASNPTRFLSTVQIGITVIGTLAAAFGGARVADHLTEWFVQAPWPLLNQHASAAALSIVVVAISFLSLVVGELAPKRIALRNAEGLARIVARPMNALAVLARPAVWLLSVCTDSILWVLGGPTVDENRVSVDDIQHLIELGTIHGVLDPAEQKVAIEALRLGDHAVREIMRPRIELDALDVATPQDEIIGAAAMAGFSRLPVYEGDLDHIVGYVHIKDLLREIYLRRPVELRKMLHAPLFVPETLPLDRLLELFQKKGTQLAIVLDEFGGTQGAVTLEDVFIELVGEIRDEHYADEQPIVRRDDGSLLVDGGVGVEDLLDELGRPPAAAPANRRFSTVAGLVLMCLEHIPQVGERVAWEGLEIEVVDMDGPRIDRLLVRLLAPPDINELPA